MTYAKDETEQWLRRNDAVVEDIVRFFKTAPITCIRDVRDQLLKEGLELEFGMAGAFILEPTTNTYTQHRNG